MDIHFHYDALEAADIISRAVAAGSSITQVSTLFSRDSTLEVDDILF